MSSAANYCKAARPEPPRCIGLQLRPYSLGHHITLRAYDSTFLNGQPPVYSDLVLGVFICSQPWRGWQEWKDSWKFPVFLKIWGWLNRRFHVEHESEKFAAYLSAGQECPEVNVPANARSLEAAWESRLRLFLIRELRLSHEEAMDYPLALAWQDYCAWGEEAGRITLLSDADRAGLDFVKSDRFTELARAAEEAGRAELAEMKARAEKQPTGAN